MVETNAADKVRNSTTTRLSKMDYDALGRMTGYHTGGDLGSESLQYRYDAQGNRRAVRPNPTNLSENETILEHYLYDNMDRHTGTVLHGSNNSAYLANAKRYDYLGRNIVELRWYQDDLQDAENDGVRQDMFADDVQITRYNDQSQIAEVNVWRPNGQNGDTQQWLNELAAQELSANRIASFVNNPVTGVGLRQSRTDYAWSADGQITSQTLLRYDDNGDQAETDPIYYDYDYLHFAQRKVDKISESETVNGIKTPRDGYDTTYAYDLAGNLVRVRKNNGPDDEHGSRRQSVYLTNSADGTLLAKHVLDQENVQGYFDVSTDAVSFNRYTDDDDNEVEEYTGDGIARNQQVLANTKLTEHYLYYANGHYVGSDGLKKQLDETSAASYLEYGGSSGAITVTPFDVKTLAGIVVSALTDRDANYSPLSQAIASVVPNYTVQSADETLQQIALSVYGDASLWYIIADANNLAVDAELTVGQLLQLPAKIGNVRNAHNTFKPLNPLSLLGDRLPSAPTVPIPNLPTIVKSGSLSFAQIVVAIVAAFVEVVGYFFAEVSGGASIVLANAIAQGMRMEAGIQEDFNWGQLAASAYMANGASSAATAGDKVWLAVESAAVNYAVNKAVDDETSFSWRSFAQSAVQAYYKGKAGESVNPINPFYDFAASTAIEFAIQGDVLEGDSAKLWWANKVGGWAGSAAIASEAVREFFGDDEAVKQQTGRDQRELGQQVAGEVGADGNVVDQIDDIYGDRDEFGDDYSANNPFSLGLDIEDGIQVAENNYWIDPRDGKSKYYEGGEWIAEDELFVEKDLGKSESAKRREGDLDRQVKAAHEASDRNIERQRLQKELDARLNLDIPDDRVFLLELGEMIDAVSSAVPDTESKSTSVQFATPKKWTKNQDQLGWEFGRDWENGEWISQPVAGPFKGNQNKVTYTGKNNVGGTYSREDGFSGRISTPSVDLNRVGLDATMEFDEHGISEITADIKVKAPVPVVSEFITIKQKIKLDFSRDEKK